MNICYYGQDDLQHPVDDEVKDSISALLTNPVTPPVTQSSRQEVRRTLTGMVQQPDVGHLSEEL